MKKRKVNKGNLFSKLSAIIFVFGIVSCKDISKDTAAIQQEDARYFAELQDWQNERFKSLKAKDGWLNLAGLYWLNEGENTIGADSTNTIQLPAGKSDDFVGTYTVENGKIIFTVNPTSVVTQNNEAVVVVPIFPAEKAVILEHKNIAWFVIQRGEKFAIRLRDYDSELAKNFSGVATYPFKEQWKVKAKLVPPIQKLISITDITDRVSEQETAGTLHFEIGGKPHSLVAIASGDKLFVIFGDATNSEETYDTGRFLYAQLPDADGYTWLDFNKAYNPPCAFTPYSTCPLPPPQNILTIKITAGEKRFIS
ncbi:DUF1684 domain-containing protein [Arenibacter sp. GZD96]|uniref:DUF1684 domain-containing protein n=1 Tax=Aurantibrevibacter litoralis TaxID=3106030 RepID=UPI002B001DF9|nr:DUF1684 domain-containing protein [Arenibacter sp. GZD-96]MEA1784838.1 DUF1684 domain-containing protein [Arenibacter sp. GZD-96]